MKLLLFHKPFQVLTKFTTSDGRPTLRDYVAQRGIYPAGRLDYESEGLLLLTDTGAVQSKLSDPRNRTPKTYWVQVENEPGEQALASLRAGIQLADGVTLPAEAERMECPSSLWPRDPPIRVRKAIPTAWLCLTIYEGRNRQVRRMTAAVGHPTLRLVRWSVGPWAVDDLMPGAARWATAKELDEFLNSAVSSVGRIATPRVERARRLTHTSPLPRNSKRRR